MMENKEFSYDQLISEIKKNLDKMNSSEITMDESIKLFEKSLEMINLAKNKLEDCKGKINKVLEDNSIEEFE